MRILKSMALSTLFSLVALASPLFSQAATFVPVEGQAEFSLVEGKSGSGVIRFSVSGVSERIVRGRRSALLSIPMEVDNRSHKDLLVNTLDLWIVTPDGTVLSQPELRQNGVAVWRAEVNAKKRSQLVALFRLGSAAAFDSFELHWGGLLAYRARSGVVNYAAAPGEGYEPPAMAAAPVPQGAGGGYDDEYVYDELAEAEPYQSIEDPYYEREPYYGLSVGIGYGYGYGYYPYYGYRGYGYGYYPYYGHHYSYGYYAPYYGGSGHHGSSGRQAKEDAILRQAGLSPTGGSGNVRRVDSATARSRPRSSRESGRVATTRSRSSVSRATGSRASRSRVSSGRVSRPRASGSRSSVGRAGGSRGSRSSVGRAGGSRGSRGSVGRSSGGRSGGGRSGGGRSGGGSRSSGRGRGR